MVLRKAETALLVAGAGKSNSKGAIIACEFVRLYQVWYLRSDTCDFKWLHIPEGCPTVTEQYALQLAKGRARSPMEA